MRSIAPAMRAPSFSKRLTKRRQTPTADTNTLLPLRADKVSPSVPNLTQDSQPRRSVAWSAYETFRHLPLPWPRRPCRTASPDRQPQHASQACLASRDRAGHGRVSPNTAPSPPAASMRAPTPTSTTRASTACSPRPTSTRSSQSSSESGRVPRWPDGVYTSALARRRHKVQWVPTCAAPRRADFQRPEDHADMVVGSEFSPPLNNVTT